MSDPPERIVTRHPVFDPESRRELYWQLVTTWRIGRDAEGLYAVVERQSIERPAWWPPPRIPEGAAA